MGAQALFTSATGMSAMDFQLNVIANNLANIDTTAFKKSRANFADILYQTLERPGLRNGLDQPVPVGKQVGLGVDVTGTQLNFSQGGIEQTTSDLDLAILGDGFFQVQAFIDGQEQTVFTRAGAFSKNADGELVMAGELGARLEPAITIPQDAVKIQISPQGRVEVTVTGSTTPTEVGQIELARFVNPAGLEQLGNNLYQQNDASGAPILGNPGQEGLGTLQQFNLEQSNVDPVTELVALIQTQRYFELNSQALQAGDETLQAVNNLRR